MKQYKYLIVIKYIDNTLPNTKIEFVSNVDLDNLSEHYKFDNDKFTFEGVEYSLEGVSSIECNEV